MSNSAFLLKGPLLTQGSRPSELDQGESDVECLFPEAVTVVLSLDRLSWVPLECSKSLF